MMSRPADVVDVIVAAVETRNDVRSHAVVF